jgi:hypothetical protein
LASKLRNSCRCGSLCPFISFLKELESDLEFPRQMCDIVGDDVDEIVDDIVVVIVVVMTMMVKMVMICSIPIPLLM